MSEASGAAPCVHVLLASYQGGRYIREQLESIAGQTHPNWTLTVSDDGSTDDTVRLCEAFSHEHGGHRIRVIKGPGRRSTANFFHLLRAVEPTSSHDLVAFSDQDDVWLPEKLSRAVEALRALRPTTGQPALYAARTRLVNERLEPIGVSRLPQRPLGFGNALLQNVASGNTMVFNQPLLRLMRRIKPEHSVLHDWTAYQVVTGCGGQMHFDPEPCLLYRQHADNLIGSQGRSWDKVLRMGMLFKGQYRTWGDQTEAAMNDIANELQPKALDVLRKFQDMRRRPDLIGRMQAGRHSGLWRQTRSGRASFWLGLALNQL
ncbi:glycosyltransferase family 2 protein [Hydrogenophaga sp. H7]|uniref:glycosyltransferase family 2 protein n=1 Tax=Hydrogenophaga sp. H7 TaxID=1882399 RepID=UPI0009A4018A|nr:glycosyltransferase family 2 protein [Hydrogenophaga sp. H7]